MTFGASVNVGRIFFMVRFRPWDPLVSTYSKRIDCECWSPSDVREHVIGFGECFAPFAEALFKDSIPGYALLRVHPESILRDYADHTCNSCLQKMKFMCFEVF